MAPVMPVSSLPIRSHIYDSSSIHHLRPPRHAATFPLSPLYSDVQMYCIVRTIQYNTQQPTKRQIIRNISHGQFQLAKTNVYLLKESRRICHLSKEALIELLPLYVQKLAGDICGFVVSTGLCSLGLPAFILSTVINLGMMTRHSCKIYNWLQEMERRGLELNLEWTSLIWRAFVGVAIKILSILITLNRQELLFALGCLADVLCDFAHILFPGSIICAKAVFTALYKLIHELKLDKIHHSWERISNEIRCLANPFTSSSISSSSPCEAEKTEASKKTAALMIDATSQQPGGGMENAISALENRDEVLNTDAKEVVKSNLKHAAVEQVYYTAFEDPANEIYDKLERAVDERCFLKLGC